MNKEKLSLIFSIGFFILFSLMAWEALSFKELARFFPQYIAIGAAVLSLFDIFFKIKKLQKIKQENEPLHGNLAAVMKYILWIFGYLIMIYLVGLVLATIIFLAGFLMVEAKLSLVKTGLSVGVVIILIMFFGDVMKLYWPRSLLASFLGW
jgi:hypothetical protein